jgi:ketosteroid isomerase-like protein
MNTQEVLDHHLAAFGAGDADEIAKDYTADSVLINQQGVFVGHEAIREGFARVFAGPFAPGTYEFTMDMVSVEGETAFIAWHAECAAIDIVFGTDTFVIRNGKIAVHTYGIKVQPH